MEENIKINKDMFSFKLGTTSFIYPEHILPNVRKLGSVFDEIELLIFESIPESVLPSKQDINELSQLAGEFDLTYNVHLPVDVSLTSTSKLKREKAIETIQKVVDLFYPLKPTTHTLHLEFNDFKLDKNRPEKIREWHDRSSDAARELSSLMGEPDIITIETLDYPFELIESIIDEYGFSVCVDAGHIIKYGYSIKRIFEKYHGKIPLIHLHGVDFSMTPPKDHISLDRTPEHKFAETLDVLKNFKGVVSLEVFNKNNLVSSLNFLEKHFGC